jgi:hypothetical protein
VEAAAQRSQYLQLAVNHVAAFVGPDTAALHTCAAVGEADRLRSEPDRRPLCPGKQQRPNQEEGAKLDNIPGNAYVFRIRWRTSSRRQRNKILSLVSAEVA